MTTAKKTIIKVLRIFLIIVFGIIAVFSAGMYFLARIATPPQYSVIPMSDTQIINSFYEHEDEIISITRQLQNHPEEYLDWDFFTPDEITSGFDYTWKLDKDSDFYKSIYELNRDGFTEIHKCKEFIEFNRWNSVSKARGIIYSQTDPREHFSEDYRELELKETNVKNFYYYSYNYDWD